MVNKEQEAVVSLFIEKLEGKIKECNFTDYSQTYIPLYDTILAKGKKKFL
ncbi:MAG: hypothetical protein ACK521_12555 [bacterium]